MALQEVREAVLRHLIAIIKNAEQKEHESVLAGSGSYDSVAEGQKAEGLNAKWVDRDGHKAEAKKQAAEEQQASMQDTEEEEAETEMEEEEVEEPPVSINLSKMTEDMIELFVKVGGQVLCWRMKLANCYTRAGACREQHALLKAAVLQQL